MGGYIVFHLGNVTVSIIEPKLCLQTLASLHPQHHLFISFFLSSSKRMQGGHIGFAVTNHSSVFRFYAIEKKAFFFKVEVWA